MSVIDTPDGQYNSVDAQVLLASEGSTATTVTVTLPANVSTVAVYTALGSVGPSNTLTCKGTTTSVFYPGALRITSLGMAFAPVRFFAVSPANDGAVTLTWSSAPGESWFVVGMNATQVVDIPALNSLVQNLDSGATPPGVVAYGADGPTTSVPISTDASGNVNVNIISGASPTLTYLESFITANVSGGGAGAYTNITSLNLTAGTWLIWGSVIIDRTTTNVGEVDILIGPNSASVTGSYTAAEGALGDLAGAAELMTLRCMCVVVLTASATVYLNAVCNSGAPTYLAEALESSVGNATGLIAVNIA